jgi:hypothetical protein
LTIYQSMSNVINSIAQFGLKGMQDSLSNIAEKADRISKSFTPESTEDPTSDIIGMKLDEFTYKASAKIVKTADELAETALDILA